MNAKGGVGWGSGSMPGLVRWRQRGLDGRPMGCLPDAVTFQ